MAALQAGSPGVVAGDVLATLRRFDGDVEEVLASSGHVSLYNMSVDAQQWQRKNVEGSLFLIKRRSAPRFRMMVLNKMSTENYVEDIHGGLDFELNPPYLMYTHGNSEIMGVWFYEQEDMTRIEEVLKRIKQHSQAPVPPASPAARPAAPVRSAGGNGDDDAFWDKGTTPASAAAAQQRLQQQQQQQQLLLAAQQRQVPNAGPAEASSNLANLLRNAQLKQQHQQVVDPSQAQMTGGPLPPSFFAQQHQQPQHQHQQHQHQQQPLQRPFIQAPPPTPAAAPLAAASPHAKHAGAYPPAQPQSPMPPPQPLLAPPAPPAGGALAKLFANAHKAAPPPPAAVLQPPPPVQAPAPPPPALAPQLPAAAAAAAPPPPAASNGIPDEERVRRLLGRMATNEALLKLLAVEMRAVGLL
ncbi:mRNA-decapping enzyme-like protein [Tetrabaena socialis]|uniref:mRNA-decapping enzyme-like protein n=1 Tax=Tetrabaena socialis TaxID=47790 RepID=A0A2J8A0B7_9CHLO|nr:mRNA-decapping enzyme-like protein [Tetrabaena socialis]|eukprot:PNH05971.1 mRNA-decapping enzyme-like protein [Tetrabaena socialis]